MPRNVGGHILLPGHPPEAYAQFEREHGKAAADTSRDTPDGEATKPATPHAKKRAGRKPNAAKAK